MTRRSKGIRGFTIIEVSLFLAITALIFIGVTAGIANNITRQRYNDATNDFVSFLRSVYSEVVNTSNTRDTDTNTVQYACSLSGQPITKNDGYPGRSKCVIYGKVLSFGEDADTVYSYDLIGDIYDSETFTSSNNEDSATLEALKKSGADIINISNTAGACRVSASNSNSYTPNWGATLQATGSTAQNAGTFTGTLLIVRSPITGTVHTYYSTGRLGNINQLLSNVNCASAQNFYNTNKSNNNYRPVNNLIKNNSFSAREVNICLNTPDLGVIGRRRAIRINQDGHNASAVNLLAADDPAVVGSGGLCP